MSLDVIAQLDTFKVKEGSFKHVPSAIMDDKYDHYDGNDLPMSLIKITTENIDEQQRLRLVFSSNRATMITKEPRTGQMWIYITSQFADFIEIKHPDYGTFKYYLPEKLCDWCIYEMVLQYIPVETSAVQRSQNNFLIINVEQQDAAIFIDNNYIGNGSAEVPLQIGLEHTYKIECDLYHSEIGNVMMTAGDPVEKNISLRPAHGFINVNTEPEEGAIVYIDGKKVGTSPYKSDKLASGTYKVKTLKTMYNPVEQTVTVTDGNTTQATLNMSANFVNVTINTDNDADIYVDEEFKAKGTWNGRLSEGTHFLEARKDKHRTQSKNVNLVLGKDETITIDNLEPIYGSLELRSNPTKADIYIDGQHIGQTPRVINDLLIGNHELKLQKQGCATLTKTITIKEGETTALNETLSTGKEISITTGQNGDKIYVDNEYVGLSPLTANISYGKHEIKAIRGSQTATKDVDVTISSSKQECVLAFGKMITINSSAKGDDIYVDGKKVGETPMEIDFSLGNHEVEVRRGKLYETKTLQVSKNSSSSYNFVPRKEPLDKYLSRGINFITLNVAYSVAPQTSFGLTYGQVKKVGWFVSAMTNFGFRFGANEWEELYNVDEAVFSGESSKARFSLTGGLLLRIGGAAYMKLGAGYGARAKCWELNGNWYEYTPDTYRGVDLTAGLMFNTNGCAISADLVTTNFKTLEFKLGIGINWN